MQQPYGYGSYQQAEDAPSTLPPAMGKPMYHDEDDDTEDQLRAAILQRLLAGKMDAGGGV